MIGDHNVRGLGSLADLFTKAFRSHGALSRAQTFHCGDRYLAPVLLAHSRDEVVAVSSFGLLRPFAQAHHLCPQAGGLFRCLALWCQVEEAIGLIRHAAMQFVFAHVVLRSEERRVGTESWSTGS